MRPTTNETRRNRLRAALHGSALVHADHAARSRRAMATFWQPSSRSGSIAQVIGLAAFRASRSSSTP